ncbi:tetratricopeptide repeat protein [Gelidibacter sp. F63206]|uniref:tetratricopeptide repeat-containing sensor histidine kinase n=1 Tax=Gelidibacter sp. F63206 TaxID=2926425 RepID=UPI001FF4D40F|nr:tetratricopeptide repeat protein [Gelidibacter sp. F63206]MCK0114506.1 sensor histidine kinase [Gelidibacter sp. F63206]
MTIRIKALKILTCFLLLGFITQGFSQGNAEKLNDSAMALYKQDPQKALLILEIALDVAQKNKQKSIVALSKNNLGIVYRDLGQFQKAKALSEEGLANAKDEFALASAYNNIGASNRSLGNYEDALIAYLKALDIYEKENAVIEQATVTNNIGMVYSYLGMNSNAIENHLKAITIFEKENNQKGMSDAYNNIAILYANDGELDKALNYFKNSLAIEISLKSQKGIAESVNNVGAVFYYMQEIDSAMAYFNQSASMERAIGNLAGVGASYNNMAQILLENGRVDDAKIYIDSAYHYASISKAAVDIETALNMYSQYYEAKNDTKTALYYFKNYANLKDSLLNIETNSKVAKLEIEYQTEKKEKEILSQRADIAEKELDLSKKNSYIVGLLGLAVVLTLLGLLFYNQQKLKNRQLQKENQLKDALIKIETQNRLQEQRLRISRDLHDNIGAQLTFIISSLDNLKYGFQLPDKLSAKLKFISEFTTTTIYELRDTIWAMNKNEISLEDLQIRISNFVDKANTTSEDVIFSFESDDGLNTGIKFTSVDGMNIYRIIQEAMNNALKYANAQRIAIKIQLDNQQLKISISDDGQGFDTETVTMGNGLNNMNKRANEIGAEISIESINNKGTKVNIEIPLQITNTTFDV